MHALVPGGGPSQDGQQWVRSKLRRVRGEDKPYLVDNRVLSARFRDKFLAGLTRLHRDGKLKLTGSWSSRQDPAAFRDWLQPLCDCDWVVCILRLDIRVQYNGSTGQGAACLHVKGGRAEIAASRFGKQAAQPTVSSARLMT